MSMHTAEELAANRLKRPIYARGDRLRVTEQGSYYGAEGTVVDIKAYQNLDGFVVTYFYTLEMDNLGRIDPSEEHVTPLADEPDDQS